MNTKPTTRNKYENQAQTSKRLQSSPQSQFTLKAWTNRNRGYKPDCSSLLLLPAEVVLAGLGLHLIALLLALHSHAACAGTHKQMKVC